MKTKITTFQSLKTITTITTEPKIIFTNEQHKTIKTIKTITTEPKFIFTNE